MQQICIFCNNSVTAKKMYTKSAPGRVHNPPSPTFRLCPCDSLCRNLHEGHLSAVGEGGLSSVDIQQGGGLYAGGRFQVPGSPARPPAAQAQARRWWSPVPGPALCTSLWSSTVTAGSLPVGNYPGHHRYCCQGRAGFRVTVGSGPSQPGVSEPLTATRRASGMKHTFPQGSDWQIRTAACGRVGQALKILVVVSLVAEVGRGHARLLPPYSNTGVTTFSNGSSNYRRRSNGVAWQNNAIT